MIKKIRASKSEKVILLFFNSTGNLLSTAWYILFTIKNKCLFIKKS